MKVSYSPNVSGTEGNEKNLSNNQGVFLHLVYKKELVKLPRSGRRIM
jgi:hypothetical protein